MELEIFLSNFESFNSESFKQNLSLVIKNDNLKNAIKVSQFMDINHYEDSYFDFFNIAFNSKCIKIFKFLWKNKRSYDNDNILIKNEILSKKSRIGKFYFDQLNMENNVYGTFIDHCYKGNINNISHILSYVKDKDLKKKICFDGYYICRTSHKNLECAKYILHQNKKEIMNNLELLRLINNKNNLKRCFINYSKFVYKKGV